MTLVYDVMTHTGWEKVCNAHFFGKKYISWSVEFKYLIIHLFDCSSCCSTNVVCIAFEVLTYHFDDILLQTLGKTQMPLGVLIFHAKIFLLASF